MEPSPVVSALGQGGWLSLLALCIFVLVRLLKANLLDAALAKLSIPSIPKKLLPWIALFLGFLAGAVQSKIAGATWGAAALAGCWGLVSGAMATATNETLPSLLHPAMPATSNVVFGEDAGPDAGPAATAPSVRPGKDPPASG